MTVTDYRVERVTGKLQGKNLLKVHTWDHHTTHEWPDLRKQMLNGVENKKQDYTIGYTTRFISFFPSFSPGLARPVFSEYHITPRGWAFCEEDFQKI